MAKVMEEITAVATTQSAGLPAVIDFSADTGSGFEEADASSFAIPFLRMLQATSGQCKKKDAAYIEGAEEGDFLNTVTGEIYKDGLTIIPCHYAHKYNEWAPDRGGFAGSHSAAEYVNLRKEQRQDSKGAWFEANVATGNSLVDTREHYVIIVDGDKLTPALMTISGTEIKKSKRWMTLMQGIKLNGQTAPMFSQKYRLTSVGESNDKGSWAGIKVEHLCQVTSIEEYNAAKSFREMVRSGEAKVSTEEAPF